eukprot:6194725-Pleurochrysis_carterae.AAC.1
MREVRAKGRGAPAGFSCVGVLQSGRPNRGAGDDSTELIVRVASSEYRCSLNGIFQYYGIEMHAQAHFRRIGRVGAHAALRERRGGEAEGRAGEEQREGRKRRGRSEIQP